MQPKKCKKAPFSICGARPVLLKNVFSVCVMFVNRGIVATGLQITKVANPPIPADIVTDWIDLIPLSPAAKGIKGLACVLVAPVSPFPLHMTLPTPVEPSRENDVVFEAPCEFV
jgi:hypothetical protein